MRLIFALCNNWGDYGGKAQYVSWGKEAGVDLNSDEDFFSDPTLKSYYKAFVEVSFGFATSSNHQNSTADILSCCLRAVEFVICLDIY
jgi:endo-1,4-beta-mannosidase